MPTPVSATVTSTQGPERVMRTCTRPPRSVNRPALLKRLPTIGVSRTGFPSTQSGAPGASMSRLKPVASRLLR